MSFHLSHHPQEVVLAQLSLYVHKGGLKPHSFYFCISRFCLYFAARLLNVTTREDTDDYDQVWMSSHELDYGIFRVKASANAHILLSDTILDAHANVYEVVIGISSNTESVIRESKYGTDQVRVDTPGIVDINEVRFFWCKWTDQKLQVGGN